MIHRLGLAAALLALGACATPQKTVYGANTCEPPPVPSPDRQCTAYSKQGWGGIAEDAWTQLFVGCKVDGTFRAPLRIGYPENPEHGLAIRWLSRDHVEIGTPAGAAPNEPEELHWFSDGQVDTGYPPGATLVHIVHITYRDITPKDREWEHSCYAQRPRT